MQGEELAGFNKDRTFVQEAAVCVLSESRMVSSEVSQVSHVGKEGTGSYSSAVI